MHGWGVGTIFIHELMWKLDCYTNELVQPTREFSNLSQQVYNKILQTSQPCSNLFMPYL